MVKRSLEEALSSEVMRKLRLATEAETKEDREIICEEVFCDITGILDPSVQERLGLCKGSSSPGEPLASSETSPALPTSTQHPPCFYEVLARYYHRNTDGGVAVMFLCQKLWGQGYAAPIFTLLLHRWLLLRRDATDLSESKGDSDKPDGQRRAASWLLGVAQPQPQRVKHINVMVMGIRQLFLGDIQSGQRRFAALYHFLADEMVLGPSFSFLSSLPLSSKSELLGSVAAVLPYYSDPVDMEELLARFPPPTATPKLDPSWIASASAAGAPDDSGTSPAWAQASEGDKGPSEHDAGAGAGAAKGGGGGAASSSSPERKAPSWFKPGSGADFLVGEVTDTLGKIRSETGLLHYLRALAALGDSPHFPTLGNITKLRLQSELYSLASPGGPHYPPKTVRKAALITLDRLFPLGKGTRRVVRTIFRLLHPTDWLGEFWWAPMRWWGWLYGKIALAAFWLIYRVVVWRPGNTSSTAGSNTARSSEDKQSNSGASGGSSPLKSKPVGNLVNRGPQRGRTGGSRLPGSESPHTDISGSIAEEN
mmetsp:Transcript_34228/g.75951  ORF Transcript_34228/g.75951 Transcript_34228/m.75951 type:complete len:538 (-) Transcript_34228:177-1790(-)|eukprot:CAMPEP_0202901464 /NCGR_PEP_ID=MMETSP1392-20130828/14264_1 /ASSEMBLY_ACC=CAM_ASM_000868 /TAXON_ID=225041 /ORGANISM="Chlamydomonas chlamydogama, Strain SAG 11-48b" /LENGTH=537 /DNA_ID=CAMNT_0049588025 /DNA_START=296 /DNA_END=1909 /DNA_ORIENTATION=+